jgi:RND family efflux transporter MFP subunit
MAAMRIARWMVVGCCWAAGAVAADIRISTDQVRLLDLQSTPATAATDLRISGLAAQIEIAAEAQRTVVAPFAGQVLVVHAEIGDRVAAGAPLADLASAEQAAANARVSQAQALERKAGAQARRDQQLFDEGVIARARLEASSADWQAAQSVLQAERSALVDTESLGAGRYRLLAPIAGVVIARELQTHTPVSAWSAAYVIADPAQLVAVIQVPVARAAAIALGDRVQIGAASGTVTRIAAVVDQASQSLTVRAAIDPGAALRGGQRASAELMVAAPDAALTLPRAALWFEGDAARVFVEVAAGHYRSVEVEVLAQDQANAVVRGALEVGAPVVTQGVAALKALRETP